MHLLEAGGRQAPSSIENLDADNLVLVVEIENDAGLHFLGLDDLGIVQAKIQRVGILGEVNFQGLPFCVRSKNTVTTLAGFADAL